MQEVIGTAMIGVLKNVQTETMLSVIKEYGYDDIDPEQWYSAQAWSNFLYTIQNQSNGTTNLVAIGQAIVEGTVMPPGFDDASFPVMLKMWNDHYEANHRGDIIGNIVVEEINLKHYAVNCTTLYPDNLLYGMAHGFARRSLAKGQPYKIWYDEKSSRRDDGGDYTRIHISWT